MGDHVQQTDAHWMYHMQVVLSLRCCPLFSYIPPPLPTCVCISSHLISLSLSLSLSLSFSLSLSLDVCVCVCLSLCVCVCSLTNHLGANPEKCEPGCVVTQATRGGFFILEVSTVQPTHQLFMHFSNVPQTTYICTCSSQHGCHCAVQI